MNDAFDRAMRFVADRIALSSGCNVKLARIGNELPRNRIVRIGRVDQIGHAPA